MQRLSQPPRRFRTQANTTGNRRRCGVCKVPRRQARSVYLRTRTTKDRGMLGLPYTAWLRESAAAEIRSCKPAVFDLPQCRSWRGSRRTCWSNAQPECAVFQLYQLSYQDPWVSFASGFLQVSYEKDLCHLLTLWTSRVKRRGTATFAEPG